jgi:hypothetical protein
MKSTGAHFCCRVFGTKQKKQQPLARPGATSDSSRMSSNGRKMPISLRQPVFLINRASEHKNKLASGTLNPV